MSNNIKKIIHICIIITILVAIGFAGLIIVLRYDKNGETNMPFDITKITIISTTDAKDNNDENNKWNLSILQNNDVYIDVQKNSNYHKKAIIDKIIIDNINIEKKPQIGEITLYKPSNNKLAPFENKDEFKATDFTYTGDKTTNIQDMKISNQGGRLAFRCANNNLGKYISNDEEELDYNKLLEKIKLKNSNLQFNISFDIKIILTNNITFKANTNLDMPIGDIVQNGKTSKEITDLNIIFKRE